MMNAFPPLLPISQHQNLTNQTEGRCVFNEEFKFLLLPLSYGAVFALGLPLNVAALWVFITKMRPWSASTVYMFNLAMSDLLYVLSLPMLIYYYAHLNHWPFGEALCKTVRFLFYANLYCSILFLTCISVHRYLGVCHPIRSLQRVKVKHAHMVCAGVWLSVTVCLVPNLLFVTVSTRGNDTLCHDTTRAGDFARYLQYSTSMMSLLFWVPCLVIAGCYGLMARELRKPPVSRSHQILPSYKKRSIKTITLVLTVFAVCFLPFHVTRTLYYYTRHLGAQCQLLNVVNFTYKITRPLASANSCVNPILYLLASEGYRKRLVRVVTGRRLAAGQSGPTPREEGGSLAVISTEVTQRIGSLGSQLGERGGEARGRNWGDGGERERNMEHREGERNLKQEEIEENGRECRGERRDWIEGDTTERECRETDSKKEEKTHERRRELLWQGGKREIHAGEKSRRWSVCRGRDAVERSEETLWEGSMGEAEGSSAWDLLESVRPDR